MSSWLSTSAIAGVVAFATWALLRLAGYGKREALLPPGPPTKLLVGNMTIWPKSAPHLRFTEWASQYGEIYSLKLAHKTYVVLTSLDAIHDILGKQSALSSDRPPNHIRDCIEGQDNHLALGRNTPRWRALRRAAQQIVSPQACRDHLAIQQAESVQLIFDILQKPKVVRQHLQRYATSVIFAVMFGIRLPLSTTPLFLKFWEMLDKTTHLSSPTSHPPIDTFPILKYIPERWAPWKAKCRELKALQRRVLGDILGLIKDRLAVGAGNGCFMEEVYTRAEEWGLDEDAVLPFGFVMTAAGADTTATFLHNFVLFITKHPEVQQKAQEEITRVVGNDRMPELSDFANLPYLQAVINETHRLRPVASLAVPHAASEDIRYGNYVIPKGAVIFQNTWGLFHDPAVFPDPDTFYPERFIVDPELNEYVDYIFGSGRRYCVGVHLAQNSIRINTMNLLWAFNFRKMLNEAGSVIELGLKEANQAGLVQRPEDFPVSIKPRSAHHEKVLRQAMKDTGEAFTPFEYDLTEEDRVYAETTRREACKEAGSKGGVS